MEPKVANVGQTLLKAEQEIERLKGLMERFFTEEFDEQLWEQFKKDNNL